MTEENLDITRLLTPDQYVEFKKHIITNMHFQLCNNLVEEAKKNPNKIPKEDPVMADILEQIRLFEKEFGEHIIKI